MMQNISIILVCLGILLLARAIIPAYTLCRRQQHWGWRALLLLVVFFTLGYVVVAIYLSQLASLDISLLLIAGVLFCGSIFVNLVIFLSRNTINRIDEAARLDQHNALHDDLTELPNRKHLMQHLQQAISQANADKAPLSVMMMDLNQFKSINDSLGHPTGDELLIQLSQRLTNCLQPGQFLARMGGDEFTIVVTQGEASLCDTTESLCFAIRQQLEQPFDLNGYKVVIGASPGIATFPEHGLDAETLLKHADIAMYEAKREKLLCCVYEPSMSQHSEQALSIASRLPEAITKDEFELHYQPLICNLTQSVYGVEALIRWPQADGNYVPAAEFINLAEQSHLIRDITRWVIKAGLAQLHQWHQLGLQFNLKINISARDLDETSLVDYIKQQLLQHQIAAKLLTLEITEHAVITNRQRSSTILQDLHDHGVQISLDDFGTGHSSLTLLNALPLNQLKIDHSFVTGMEANEKHLAIVQSTIDLGKNMHLNVVAEGIENQHQIEILDLMGCNYMQGYYLAKPMPADKLHHWLTTYGTL